MRDRPSCGPRNDFGFGVSGGDFCENGDIRLGIRVDAALAYPRQGARLSEDQGLVVKDDRRMRLTANIRQTGWLRSWILGLGRSVEVMGPQSLRVVIAGEAADSALRFERV